MTKTCEPRPRFEWRTSGEPAYDSHAIDISARSKERAVRDVVNGVKCFVNSKSSQWLLSIENLTRGTRISETEKLMQESIKFIGSVNNCPKLVEMMHLLQNKKDMSFSVDDDLVWECFPPLTQPTDDGIVIFDMIDGGSSKFAFPDELFELE